MGIVISDNSIKKSNNNYNNDYNNNDTINDDNIKTIRNNSNI